MGKKKANIFIYVILGILTVVVLYPAVLYCTEFF